MFDTDLITVDAEEAPEWFNEQLERDNKELEAAEEVSDAQLI